MKIIYVPLSDDHYRAQMVRRFLTTRFIGTAVVRLVEPKEAVIQEEVRAWSQTAARFLVLIYVHTEVTDAAILPINPLEPLAKLEDLYEYVKGEIECPTDPSSSSTSTESSPTSSEE